jgi:hypothetical protein
MDRKIIFTLVLVCMTLALPAQTKDSVKVRLNHYTLTVGAGWTHYINNLEYGDNNIKTNSAGVSFKFFWEPEHRLSLGLESGYYRMFSISGKANDNTKVVISRMVVPMLLLVRMRIVNKFYLGAGMGLAFITNKASDGNEKIVTKVTSLSNYEASASYVYPLSRHWLVGGEFKMFNFGNLDDYMYSLQATFAVRF